MLEDDFERKLQADGTSQKFGEYTWLSNSQEDKTEWKSMTICGYCNECVGCLWLVIYKR